jgi:hypothetical protein
MSKRELSQKVISKALQSNNDNGMLSNLRTWVDFVDDEALSLYPGCEQWRKRLIHTMFAWAEKPTSLEILQFCMEYKIPYTTLKGWVEKHLDIKSAYNNVKLALACHRRMGSMNKKLDGAYAYKDMHMYDPEWHAVNKYHSDMRTEEAKQSHTFVINDAKPRIVSKEEMLSEVEE